MQRFFCISFRLIAVLLLIKVTLATDFTLGSTTTYYCGEEKFENEAVTSATNYDWRKIYDPTTYPAPYDGHIDYAKTELLLMYPIMKGGLISDSSKEKHRYGNFVVYGFSTGAVDIITREEKMHDKKCLKLTEGSLSPSPSTLTPSIPSNYEGYECSQKFFSNVILKSNLNLAKRCIEQRPQDFSVPYTGPLCGVNLRCLVWPIYQGDDIGSFPKNADDLKYQIVIDENFVLKNVISTRNGVITEQCKHAQVGQLIPYVEQDTEERNGFKCDSDYYSHSYLTSEIKRMETIRRRLKYPELYRRPPFKSWVLLWPIFANGESYPQARRIENFLVMSRKHEIICAATNSNPINCCPEGTAGISSDEKNGNFMCDKIKIPYSKMVEARNQMYNYSPKTSRVKFPAKYQGPAFDVPGPYLTWPLLLYSDRIYGLNNKSSPGRFRIVLSHDYKLVGVLMKKRGKLSKCQRADRSIPGEGLDTPGWNPEDSITEIFNEQGFRKHNSFSRRKKTSSRSSTSNT